MLSTSMYMYITWIYMCIQCMYITFGFIVWAPTHCTRADRAQTVDSNLSTIHAERIQICSAPANLKSICQNIPVYSCMYIMYTNTYTLHTMFVHVCNMYYLTISAQDVLVLSTKGMHNAHTFFWYVQCTYIAQCTYNVCALYEHV
jgi:hypothetical protein